MIGLAFCQDHLEQTEHQMKLVRGITNKQQQNIINLI